MKGIDISEYNTKIDWKKLKENIDFAILRIGWIGNKQNHTLDKTFIEKYNKCKEYNIPIGIYVFNYCESEKTAIEGAKWVIKQLQGKSIDLPIYIDMENDSGQKHKLSRLGKSVLTQIVIAFNTEIEKAGFWAGVYANLDWYTNYLNKDVIKKKYTTWIAHFRVKEDKYKGAYDMLQYSSSGVVSGITGKVDLDIMYRDLIKDIKNSKNKPSNPIIPIPSIKYYPKCNKNLTSLVDALKSIKVDSSFTNRKKIAYKNGITYYNGTFEQNVKLLNLLKNGKLIYGRL